MIVARPVSVQAISWVLDHSDSTLGTRLVLLSLANHADKYGREARAAVKTYAAEAHLSPRQVQYALRKLEASGEIVCTGKHGSRADRMVNIYELPGMSGAQEVRPAATDGAQNRTERGAESDIDGVNPIAPKPSLGTVLEPSKPLRKRERDFVFDALAEVCGVAVDKSTKRERGGIAKAASEIRAASFSGVGYNEDWTYEDVRSLVLSRATQYRRRYPGAALTPNALAMHWGECAMPTLVPAGEEWIPPKPFTPEEQAASEAARKQAWAGRRA